jgi:hypothetical protein
MQRLYEGQMCKAHEKKEVDMERFVFLGNDSKVYIYDGKSPPKCLTEEGIPIIKNRKKRKKGFYRETIIQTQSEATD